MTLKNTSSNESIPTRSIKSTVAGALLCSCAHASPVSTGLPVVESANPETRVSSQVTAAPSTMTEASTVGEPKEPASPPPVVEIKLPTLDLVPGHVANHFPIKSSGNVIEMSRTNSGDWNLTMRVLPLRGAGESWAGYCWDLNETDAHQYTRLKVTFSKASKPTELQFKLEQPDNHFQNRALRFPTVPEVNIPLTNYPDIVRRVGRFCLVLSAPPEARSSLEAEVTLSNVTLE